MNKLYDIVIFHYPCQDGLASAYIAQLYNMNIELYPIQHGNIINLEQLKNKRILFCDYSPSLEVLNNIEKIALEICILDHHISAQRILENKPYAIFDMKQSGAGLTWNYFFPEKEMPLSIQYIQDRDLWTWKLPDSKNFTSGFQKECDNISPDNFIELFKLFNNTESKISYYIDIGYIINKEKEDIINHIIEENKDKTYIFNNHPIKIINCDYDLVSDLGSMITKDNTFHMAVLWRLADDMYTINLRANNMIDVSIIAKQYNGGGHKNAASFKSKDSPFILFS